MWHESELRQQVRAIVGSSGGPLHFRRVEWRLDDLVQRDGAHADEARAAADYVCAELKRFDSTWCDYWLDKYRERHGHPPGSGL